MKKSIVLSIVVVISSSAFAQEAKMFRGNPTHLEAFNTRSDLVFDCKRWKVDAGSPVRSTPLVVGNTVFFGSTAGEFFALDKKSGGLKWKHGFGAPINSSAAYAKEKVFFTNNEQKLFALNESNGRVIWSFPFGKKLNYPWRFDYYYSSPVLYKDWLIVGGDDGFLYTLHQSDGKLVWKYDAKSIIRSSAAVYSNKILFGDVDGRFHALDVTNGKEVWTYKTDGDTLVNEKFGFDRKAILSSAVVSDNKVLFGSRAGFLYCLDASRGNLLWKMDHKVSWVISTPAIQDSILVTGTSDGRFVQAIHLQTGKQLWRTRTAAVVWSSPIIVNGIVYAADFDGQLYCLDLLTGKRISEFLAGERIMSSPVYDNDLIYFGSDDGSLYALKGRPRKKNLTDVKRFVFFDAKAKNYFQPGEDVRIREYLSANGFKSIGIDTLASVLSSRTNKSIVVFASNYFPKEVIKGNHQSILRNFLDSGGRIVIMGTNPLAYELDETSKQPVGFDLPLADSVLGIDYGPNDTRSFGGMFTCFPTEEGKQIGLSDYWTAMLFCDPKQVDVVLGKNENGLVSAFAKRYSNGGIFVQLFLNQHYSQNLDAIIKAAEAEF